MGCCFSNDSSNEHTRRHRPETYPGATNSFQPYVVSNDSRIVSPPSLQAYNSNCSHAATSECNTRLARRSQEHNQEPIKPNRPKSRRCFCCDEETFENNPRLPRRSQENNEEPIKPNRPKTHFEANNRFQPTTTSTNTRNVSSSSLRSHNSNSYNAPTATRRSSLPSSLFIVSESYPNYSLVKTAESKLLNSVLKLTSLWDHMTDSSEYELRLLRCGSTEYENISRLFKRTTQKQFMVENIYRVQNPYLFGCYLLKKIELESRYGYVAEEFLFHGTKEENKDKICKNNFDWRKHGKSVGNIFGQGISFTPISCYASHYSENCNTGRMMILSMVLIAKETIGNRHMILPPVFDSEQCLRYDTATKEDRHVIVKFSDNEFYPLYIVYYTGQYEKKEHKSMRF